MRHVTLLSVTRAVTLSVTRAVTLSVCSNVPIFTVDTIDGLYSVYSKLIPSLNLFIAQKYK